MTRLHTKRGRDGEAQGDRRTPWQLLADFVREGDSAAGALFVEFAQAFKGRSQLHWSRGLRARFDLGREKSDEETAAELTTEQDELAATLTLDDWRTIRRHELRAAVLAILADHDWSALDQFLDPFRTPGGAPPSDEDSP